MYKKIKDIVCYCIKSGEKKIEKKVGSFELLGVDILIDS